MIYPQECSVFLGVCPLKFPVAKQNSPAKCQNWGAVAQTVGYKEGINPRCYEEEPQLAHSPPKCLPWQAQPSICLPSHKRPSHKRQAGADPHSAVYLGASGASRISFPSPLRVFARRGTAYVMSRGAGSKQGMKDQGSPTMGLLQPKPTLLQQELQRQPQAQHQQLSVSCVWRARAGNLAKSLPYLPCCQLA